MTVRGAAFLGVGSMVGAGIFALLGEAGAVAGSAVWISFLAAGTVAALQGYAVAKLGATYPSSGGIVTFLIKGFGRGHVSAVTSWLLYFAAIIVTAMVSVSFGSYGSALFFDDSTTWSKVLTIAVVLLVAVVNIAGAKFIDKVQSLIVIVLLAVFAVFIVVTLAQVDPELLAPDTYPPTTDIVSSVALTFFAYLGFTVISFTGDDLPDPARNLPRAMYLALGITTVLYVLIAVGVFGTLTVDEVVANGETALAEAAKPALGQAGFATMAVAGIPLADVVVGERQHLRGRRFDARTGLAEDVATRSRRGSGDHRLPGSAAPVRGCAAYCCTSLSSRTTFRPPGRWTTCASASASLGGGRDRRRSGR